MEARAETATAPGRSIEAGASGYRWVVLAVGTAAQATASAAMFSPAVLAPSIRSTFGLTLAQMGVVLAATSIGATPALLPWGVLTDRRGERLVLSAGLGLSAIALARVGYASGFAELVVLLVLAGGLSASVNSASGRAVMHWFAPSERGLALGIRQSSVPIGGLFAALVLPALAAHGGLGPTFALLAAVTAACAVFGALLLRSPRGALRARTRHVPMRPLRERSLWIVSVASMLLVFAQTSTMSFTVLFLSDVRGMSSHAAALVLAASQVESVVLRIWVGHRSDRRGSRVRPLRRITLVIAAAIAVVGVVAGAPLWLVVPALVVAGGIAMSWNGLAFVSVAEIAGPQATGAALGLQQTMLGAAGIVAPVTFAAVAEGTSWAAAFLASAAFPVAAWALLRPLSRVRAAR